MYKWIKTLYLLLFFGLNVSAQSTKVFIQSIVITGNTKTSPEVILRELDFSVSDSIFFSDLPEIISISEKRLLSTGLFTEADINISKWNMENTFVDITIVVKEGWYIYPYIIFELADRNFNVWAKEFDYAIERLNYGVALTHINFTGNKDKLKAKLQFGYTGKYELFYEFPYIKNGWGMTANLLHTYNKEINYITLQNKPLFFKAEDERNLLKQWRASVAATYRKDATTFHAAKLMYYLGEVDSYIVRELNPDYFLNGANLLRYLRLEYEFTLNKLHYPLYPLGGFYTRVLFRKDGFGENKNINNTSVSIEVSKFWNIRSSLIFSTSIRGKTNLQRNKVPYFLNQGLGYEGSSITGYQLYVVDGTDLFVSGNTVKYRIFQKDLNFKKWVPQRLRPLNTQIFIRFNGDFGYVYEPHYFENNPLSNNFLFGYGPGIDVILLHNFVISADFSVNKNNEKGFFFSGGFQF